jgi:DNA-binding CsgD family transcriptional regulator
VRAFDDLLGTVLCIERMAWLAGASDEEERAAVLLGVAHRLWPLLGGLSLLSYQPYLAAHAECEGQARRVLGERAFQAAFDRGAELDRDEAIAYALGEETPPAPEVPAAGDDPLAVLTPRERQVGGLITEGLSNKDIAARLVIAKRTAEAHVENMLTKLGFTTRAQLAAWYTERRQGQDRPPSSATGT